jgi:hypothetical protein
MYIFMIVALVTAVAFISFPQKEERLDPFESYIRQIHPFSGLSPDLYDNFLVTLDHFRESHEPEDLYQAINYLEELTMYAKDRDFDESIITRLGATGERIANVKEPKYSTGS